MALSRVSPLRFALAFFGCAQTPSVRFGLIKGVDVTETRQIPSVIGTHYGFREVHILFTFDIDGSHSIILEHHTPSMPRHPRYAIAFERVKQFLEKPGTDVQIYRS
jgi:hypothetical protein